MSRSLLPLIAAAALAAGCRNEPDVRKAYPVTGTVTINGTPAPAGLQVALTPQFTETDRYPIHPWATTRDDGSFTITTYYADDGAPEGEYVATVTWPPNPVSPYPTGDLMGGAFAKPELTAGLPGFKFAVSRDGAKLDLKLTLSPAQMQAVEAGKKRGQKQGGPFNLGGQ